MLSNNLYNLMTQLVEESQSLKRIKECYIDDSSNEECVSFWNRMTSDKEAHIKELHELIKKNIADA